MLALSLAEATFGGTWFLSLSLLGSHPVPFVVAAYFAGQLTHGCASKLAPSGYYEWLTRPISNRAQEDAPLLRLIRAAFTASQGIYGAPRVFLDLREAGKTCSKHRVARLMRVNRLRAMHGYRTRRWSVGKPAVLVPNFYSGSSR